MFKPTRKVQALLPIGHLRYLCLLVRSRSSATLGGGCDATQPNTPTLNQITLVDYGGSDASGVADLQANKIDTYDFALTPSAAIVAAVQLQPVRGAVVASTGST